MPCNLRQKRGDYQMTPSNTRVWPEARPPELKGVRVLIIEDSWDVGMGLKTLLEACGADIVGPVATTVDAMRLVSELAPDIALVDIKLRNGEKSYGLIDRLHEQGIRIVVMTGYADVSLNKGKVAAILQKPMQEELLLARALAFRRPARPLRENP
jgi:CheY-like chemotaxis protein